MEKYSVSQTTLVCTLINHIIQWVLHADGFILVKILIFLTELALKFGGMDVHYIKMIKYRRGILDGRKTKWKRETYRDTDNYFINYVVFKVKYLIAYYFHSLI